jgi:hypothetical protein
MSPEEQLLCDALVHLGPVETEQGLHAEGVRKIQEVLHCTLADARTTLRELRVRKRIEETTTPIEQLPVRSTRVANTKAIPLPHEGGFHDGKLLASPA